MKRYFRLALGAMAMLATMLLSAALTLRIALHGGEVPVPNFAGLTVQEASEAALHSGLDLNIENKFYSTTVPAGRILSQAPAAGALVRKDWQVRVTESLGPQQVTIPDTVGMPVREATMSLRRDQLDLGTIGHLTAPGDPDMVLAQTPPPNAGVDQPRVNLLLSSTAEGAAASFVMPSFVGMGYSAANHIAIGLGLRVAAIGGVPATPAPTAEPDLAGTTVRPDDVRVDAGGQPVAVAPAAPATPVGPVVTQSPEAGHRATRGDVIRLNFNHGNSTGGGSSSGGASGSAPGASSATSPAGNGAAPRTQPVPKPSAVPPATKPTTATAPPSVAPAPAAKPAPAVRTAPPPPAAEATPESTEPPHRNAFQKLFGLGKHKKTQNDEQDNPH